MIRHDYSQDAPLLDYEIDDFDTKSYAEEGTHPTGINDGRMRLPNRYDISKYYKRNKRNPEQGQWKKKSSDELLDFSDDFDWQITYTFPNTLRSNLTSMGSTYGGATVTFRRLYLILCEHFNAGEFFIDTYFDTVYPYTIKPEIDDNLDRIKSELLQVAEEELEGAVLTKSGDFDKRYKANRGMKAKLRRYEDFAKDWEASEGEYLAQLIKDDIISSLMSGQIPLAYDNSDSTKETRRYAGLSEDPKFFATAQLIESIQLFVKIGGNKKWQTKQGILV